MKKVYITTPIYYASGSVHIGNSLTTIFCDVLARYKKQAGFDVRYLTGMDEHGQKVKEAANKQNKTPLEYVNYIAQETKKIWKRLNIEYDDFIETTEKRHTTSVQKIFEYLLNKQDIYLGFYEGLYCVSCESFYTKSVIIDNKCPDCGKEIRKVKDESYFLNLRKYEKKLLDYINSHPNFIVPETKKNEVVAFIEQGLEDLSITRTTVDWGIKVPSNSKHTIYVWIDALSNYITSLGYMSSDDSNFKKYWLDANIYQVIAKDILRFHAIYWPIMLMALDIPLDFTLYAHGWINMKDGKMSKSKGNVIYPLDIIDKYGLDRLRYYLIRELPFSNDYSFIEELFIDKCNSELTNDLGNLLSRSVAMVNKYFNGVVKYKGEFSFEIEEYSTIIINRYISNFNNLKFSNGIEEVFNLVNKANKFIDEQTPWVLAKDEKSRDKLETVLYILLECLRLISIMLYSVIPDSCCCILSSLGINKNFNFDNLRFNVKNKYKVTSDNIKLFPRIELLKEEITENPKTNAINIEDFNKVQLRVGKIIEVKKIENSDKLLLLKIKIGDEVKQIVSGISKYYEPLDIINKYVGVVVNLQSVKIKGYESQGMILCAEDENTLELVTLEKVKEQGIIK